MSLINDAALEMNCNREGFRKAFLNLMFRIGTGITANNQNDCDLCDSVIGVCIAIDSRKWSSGNIRLFYLIYKDHEQKTFRYIFVQWSVWLQ